MAELAFLLISIIYSGTAALLWVARPLNVAFFLCLLQGIFYLLPGAMYFYAKPAFLDYTFDLLKSPYLEPIVINDVLWPLTLSLTLLLGAIIGSFTRYRRSERKELSGGCTRLARKSKSWTSIAIVIMMVPYVIVLGTVLIPEGNTLGLLVLPSQTDKHSVYGSHYTLHFLTQWPLVVAVVALIRYKTPPTILVWGLILVVCMMALGSGQRIRFVVIFLTLIFLYIWRRITTERIYEGPGQPKWQSQRAFLRIQIVGVLVATATLVPVLWWARNVANQLREHGSIVHSPFEAKGLLEALFGSPANGFPAFGMVREYAFHVGVNYGYVITDIVTMAVPRAIWPEKPVVMDVHLREMLELNTSPSIFLVNELWLSFGVLSIVISFALAAGLARFCTVVQAQGGYLAGAVLVFLCGLSPILFKNGIVIFSGYIAPLVLMTLVVSGAFAISERRKARNSKYLSRMTGDQSDRLSC